MKRILLAILALSVSALAQNPGGRLGDSQPIRSKTSITGLSFAFPTIVPNATIQVCNFPCNAVPGTNLATTYTDATLGTACPTSTQITYAGSNTCVGATDADGFWGVWVFPGQYEWTYTLSDGTSHGPYPAIVTGLVVSGGGGGGATFDPGANTQMVYVDNAQTGNVGTDPTFTYDKNTHTLSMQQMNLIGAGGFQFRGKPGTMSGSGDALFSNCGFDNSVGGALSCGWLGAAPKKMLRAGEVSEHTDMSPDGVVVTNFNADKLDGASASTTSSAGIIPIADSNGRLAPKFIPTGQVQPTAGTGSPLVYTTLAADYGRLIKSNMVGGGTIQLMNAPIPGYFFWATNITTVGVVIDPVPVCACFLNGVTTPVSIPTGQTVVVWSDGTNYFSSIPIVGASGSGITVTQNGQKLLAQLNHGTVFRDKCQGTIGASTTTAYPLAGFKKTNNVTCADASPSNVVEVPVPFAGTFKNLAAIQGTAGATATSCKVTLYTNTVASSIAIALGTSNATTVVSDTVDTLHVTQFTRFSIRVVTDQASDSCADIQASIEFLSD